MTVHSAQKTVGRNSLPSHSTRRRTEDSSRHLAATQEPADPTRARDRFRQPGGPGRPSQEASRAVPAGVARALVVNLRSRSGPRNLTWAPGERSIWDFACNVYPWNPETVSGGPKLQIARRVDDPGDAALLVRRSVAAPRRAERLGSGRIAASEVEAPNILVRESCVKWTRCSTKRQCQPYECKTGFQHKELDRV